MSTFEKGIWLGLSVGLALGVIATLVMLKTGGVL